MRHAGATPGWAVKLGLACGLAAAAISSHAQDASPPGTEGVQFGFGGNDPIAVRAETATYRGGLTVLEGNVVVEQDDTTVKSDRMDIYRDAAESDSIAGSLKLGALRRIEAKGNFEFVNPENTVTGDEGTYLADREIIIVTGNVSLRQPNGASVTGDRLVYDLETGKARFGTPCETGTAAARDCGRVRIRIE